MNPWPTAFTAWRGRPLKVWRARVATGGGMPGTLLIVDDDGITVAAGEGAVLLTEVQQEGARVLPAAEFARGRRLKTGERLGEAHAGG